VSNKDIAHLAQIATAMALVTVVTGCSAGGDQKAAQVAAKVNKSEITMHQINFAMQRLGNVPDAQVKQAQKQVLDRLVDQELLVQQALDKKLDRDPQVVQAMEASRRQILAQAYVRQVVGGAQKAQADTIKGFYEEHPELFKERRIYRFAQITVAAPADKQTAVRAKLEELDKHADKSKILPRLADWLKAQDLQFRANQVTQAAEQLPMEALPKYHKMNVGELIVSPGPQGIAVAQLIAAQTAPLTEEQATPFIEQYLQNKERLKLSEEEMKRLRAAAKIEYLGEFARSDPQPTTAPGTSVEPPQPPKPAQSGQKDSIGGDSKELKQ
jgi:EpsD family peptidyl-prolyl cis-trans isomerase